MIKTKRKCALVFLVVVSMLFNMISLSAFAEGEVVINAQDDGTGLSMTTNGSVTRSFEITDAGKYSLTVNTQTLFDRSLKITFDEGEELTISSLVKGSTYKDTTYSGEISLGEGSHTVTVLSPDGALKLMKLTLTFVSALNPPSSGEDNEESGDNTEDNEQTSYTKVYSASDLNALETKSIDKFSPSYDYGKEALLMRGNNAHYVTFDFDGESAEYSIEIEGSTGNGACEMEIINNTSEVTATISAAATNSYYAFAKNSSQNNLNIAQGNSVTVKIKSGVMFMAFVTFKKTGDYVAPPIPPIEDEKTLSASDVDSLTNATEDNGAFNISDGGSVTFKINTAVDVFNISAVLEEESEAYLNVYIDDELIATKASSEISNIGDFIFEDGEKTLKIEASGADIKIKDIKVKKVSPSEVETTVIEKDVKDYIPGGQGVGYNTSDSEDPGKNSTYIHTSNDEWVKWEVDVPEDGDYLITIEYYNYGSEWVNFQNETTGSALNVIVDKATTWATTSVSQSGDLILKFQKGKNIIKYTKPYGDLYLRKLTFTLIEAIDFQALYVGGYPVLGTNLITPSADTMKIHMTDPITTEAITNQIVISASDGKNLDFDASISDNMINIDLKDTLLEYTDYEVTVSGISSKWGDMEASKTVPFSTGGEEADGVSNFVVAESGISDANITVKGTLYGSHSKTIDGRYAKAYISKKGTSDKTYLDEAVSENGGEVILNLQMPSGSESDTYTVYVEIQYTGTKKEIGDFIYVDEDKKNDIAEDFKAATTASLVEAAFDANKEYFTSDISADMAKLSDKDAFYTHFIEYNLTSMNEFYSYYDKMYVYELLRQSASENIIYNEENCGKIGIDYNKVNLIQSNKAAFVTAVGAISAADFDSYIASLNEVIDEYLEKESGKLDISVALSSVSAQYGQGINKDINASVKQDKLKKVILKFECTEKTIIDSITVAENQNGKAVITKDDDSATVEFTYNSLYDNELLFNVSFTAASVGSYTLNYSGNLIFDFNGYDVKTDISASSFILNVSNSTSLPGSDKTSEGSISSSSGGSSSYTPPVTPEEPSDTQTTPGGNEIVFADISDYSWAEESIIALTNKGVISKPEDKKFRPGDKITREEFVKMVVCLLNINTSGVEAEFSDVNKDHWAYDYIAIASKNGLVSGMADGSFGIGEYITREQMATISARILDKYGMTADLSVIEKFSDDNDISDYAKSAVNKMRYYNIINGVGDNMFAPQKNATRAETAKMIYGLSKVVGL